MSLVTRLIGQLSMAFFHGATWDKIEDITFQVAHLWSVYLKSQLLGLWVDLYYNNDDNIVTSLLFYQYFKNLSIPIWIYTS